VRLVCAERQQDRGEAVGQRGHQASGPTVRDHQVAVVEHLLLRHELLDADVGRLASEGFRVDVSSDGQQNVGVDVREAGQQALEQVARDGVEDRPERHVDAEPRRALGQGDPVVGAEGERRLGKWNGRLGAAKRRCERREHQVAREHREHRIRR
jgi:hypothetical protein